MQGYFIYQTCMWQMIVSYVSDEQLNFDFSPLFTDIYHYYMVKGLFERQDILLGWRSELRYGRGKGVSGGSYGSELGNALCL